MLCASIYTLYSSQENYLIVVLLLDIRGMVYDLQYDIFIYIYHMSIVNLNSLRNIPDEFFDVFVWVFSLGEAVVKAGI